MAGEGIFAQEDAVIASWAAAELAPWRDYPLTVEEHEQLLWKGVDRHPTICLIRIDDGRASVDPEHAVARPYMVDPQHPIGLRALAYVAHLNDALWIYGISGSGLIAVYLDDLLPHGLDIPIFCFQKRRGERAMLLPDVDFINSRYYTWDDDSAIDASSYAGKRDEAIFVGATTGDLPITATHVAQLRNNRLRAGVYFRAHDRVVFDLPTICQCDSPETEQMIRDLDLGGRRWTWPEQLDFRYLLSLDGNGATCSRVAISLASNSVLLKYQSPHLLFYFQGMKAWQHYVPILADSDVDDLLRDSILLQPTLRRIAVDSRIFAQTYLNRLPLLRYTATLVSEYLCLFGKNAKPIAPRNQTALIDVFAHVAGRGSTWTKPGRWLHGSFDAPPIEAFRLTPAAQIAPEELTYCAFENGDASPAVQAGRLCGSVGQSRPLHGLKIMLSGRAAERFDITYDVRFADGSQKTARAGQAIQSSSAIVDLRVRATQK